MKTKIRKKLLQEKNGVKSTEMNKDDIPLGADEIILSQNEKEKILATRIRLVRRGGFLWDIP